MASVKTSVPVMADSSSKPVAEVSPEKELASFTASTIRLMTCVSVLPSSSVTATVKESEPLKLAFGVYDHEPVAASIEAVPLLDSDAVSYTHLTLPTTD